MKKSPKSKSASKPSFNKPANIIEKIDKKLDLFNILGKTMPVIILTSGSILWSLFYMSLHATVPETTELPITGEEIQETEESAIIYPENNSDITLPDKIIGKFTEDSTLSYSKIKYYYENSDGEVEEIGEATSNENSQFEADWTSATSGSYNLWAEIEKEDSDKVKTASIIVNVK